MVVRLRTLRFSQLTLGILAGTKWCVLRSLNYRGLVPFKTVTVHPSGLDHPVAVRMQGSSDPDVFEQLFVERALGFAEQLKALRPRVIIDLGANVGYVSAFLLSLFADACVLAVEPDPENADLCRRNLAPYGERARVITGAAWHTSGRLVLSRGTFGDGREWATEVRTPETGEEADVTAFDIPSLLEFCPADTIDLLKIDIEGSERKLFSLGTDRWLGRVRNLCIELHGEQCERAFESAMKGYRCERMRSGEYLVCLNIRRSPYT